MPAAILNLVLFFFLTLFYSGSDDHGLTIKNGWITLDNRIIFGNGQRTDYWGGYKGCPGNPEWIHNYKTYTALTRNDAGNKGPCKTEDLSLLTDNMIRYGYPAFVHNYGLWYDRRRDCHDESQRSSPPTGPFHEQPWARSDIPGAWDGGNKYDLLKYNDWYFTRLKEFARNCDKKGAILIYQFYNQHNILESPCHYVDFPWRPVNCIQNTGLPDTKPASDLKVYNLFYDISDSARNFLHRSYIRKCLDELSGYSNVIFDISREYTGPLSFTRFWIDTIIEWEKESGKKVVISIGATKDVQDAILNDPVRSEEIDVINLACWWYLADGSLNAPEGGKGIPGRYADGVNWALKTTPYQIYRQVREYRLKYPEKAILHAFEGSREQTLAFLMGGGSLLVRYLKYPDSQPPSKPWDPPSDYIMPEDSPVILPAYRFINNNLNSELPEMTIMDIVDDPGNNWCLGDPGRNYVVYALRGGKITIDMREDSRKKLNVTWVDPRNGEILKSKAVTIPFSKSLVIEAPDSNDWLLWLN